MYRLIAMDLDGTILRDDLTISPRVCAALAAAAARGIHLTLASGRAYLSTQRWVGELGITTPVICYQGAAIVDPRTHQRIREYTFPLAWVPEIVGFARARNLSLLLYVGEEIFVENKRHSDEFYDKWFGVPMHVVPDLERAVTANPTKFMIIDREQELDALTPEVVAAFGPRMIVVRSHRYFLEGVSPEATKGQALAWLAERLGVPQQEVMAMGDSGNDRSMIAWAGLGVAMRNATADALEVADYVAPTVDEDGAAVAIERFCLDGR